MHGDYATPDDGSPCLWGQFSITGSCKMKPACGERDGKEKGSKGRKRIESMIEGKPEPSIATKWVAQIADPQAIPARTNQPFLSSAAMLSARWKSLRVITAPVIQMIAATTTNE